MTKTESEVLDGWRESARYWNKYAALIRAMFAPISDALIDAAAISEGQCVLDIAGGIGEPAHAIAAAVGGLGSVICTDAVTEMAAAAHHQGRGLGISNVRYLACTARWLPFASDSFDAAVCRLGAMFFAEPVQSLAEVLRVAAPGGRIALAVWAAPEFNPFFRLVTEVVSRYIAPEPEESDAPGAFRYAEPGKLARDLARAGAIEVRERSLDFELTAPITLDDFWRVRLEMSDTLREKAARLTEGELDSIAREVRTGAARFFVAGEMRFPARVLIIAGKRN